MVPKVFVPLKFYCSLFSISSFYVNSNMRNVFVYKNIQRMTLLGFYYVSFCLQFPTAYHILKVVIITDLERRQKSTTDLPKTLQVPS